MKVLQSINLIMFKRFVLPQGGGRKREREREREVAHVGESEGVCRFEQKCRNCK